MNEECRLHMRVIKISVGFCVFVLQPYCPQETLEKSFKIPGPQEVILVVLEIVKQIVVNRLFKLFLGRNGIIKCNDFN